VLKVLEAVDALVTKHPAADMVSSRFGKPEFRDFYDELQKTTGDILRKSTLPKVPDEAIPELEAYLVESWGNRTRIDYGSGHELNFVSFLLCLSKLGTLTAKVYAAVVLKVFLKYMTVMRRIQTTYWLEPAGSHGVWGLDDYHFLPFLFGSSQLATHRHLRPISIHDPDILEMYGSKYMYLGCIKFINSVKTASLRWHSPMLDDISGVKKWSKVNEGMIKMYKAEVLGKLPIMQHYMFGSLIAAPEGISVAPEPGAETPHVHNHWADCCGIKVPSAIAANQMEHNKKEILRPVKGIIPFD
jgi:serine/threonine-protein phosphatase 2A activator